MKSGHLLVFALGKMVLTGLGVLLKLYLELEGFLRV